MNYIKFIITGIIFGIVLAKAQVISWFRIYEMFRFESFHMYGIIGSAVGLGILINLWIKRRNIKSISGEIINLPPKQKSIPRYLIGGTFFGLGWALSGACPGPMFILLGFGYAPMLIVIVGALLGTLLYGIIRDKLPH
jgi:uncharacterized membrane protein YedE/YeeE